MGETQVDAAPPKVARPRWPLVVGALGLLFFLASTGTGIVIYAKHASAAPAPEVAPAGVDDRLAHGPQGPSADRQRDADHDSRRSAVQRPADRHRGSLRPSLLPSADEAAPGAEAAACGAGKTCVRSAATAPATGAPAAAKPAGTDDLSNIGRR